jgi:hypothetical protein
MDKKEQNKIIKSMSKERFLDDKESKKGEKEQSINKIKDKLNRFGLPMDFDWENLADSPKELKLNIRKVATSESIIKTFTEKHGVSREYYLGIIESIIEQLHLILEAQAAAVPSKEENKKLVKKTNSIIKTKETKPRVKSEAVKERQKKYNAIRKEFDKLRNDQSVKYCLKVLAKKYKYAESTIRTIVYKQAKR